MCNIDRDTIQKINCYLPSSYIFICFSSFESRSTSIPLCLEKQRIRKAYVIRNMESDIMIQSQYSFDTICEYIEASETIEINISKSLSIANAIIELISNLVIANEKTIVIDISTFTHEALLILIKLLYDNREHFQTIKILYNGAKQYSIGDTPEEMWLSKGCRDIRNVLGYAGVIKPNLNNHLIILTGFEIERATKLVELLDPDYLTLGEGVEPTESEHIEAMSRFKEKFADWKNNYNNILAESFEFSCRDVQTTITKLDKVINGKEENFILVPLNTKLSTIATAIVALNNRKVQICYPIPELYNVKNYSEPSEHVTILNLIDLFEKNIK